MLTTNRDIDYLLYSVRNYWKDKHDRLRSSFLKSIKLTITLQL